MMLLKKTKLRTGIDMNFEFKHPTKYKNTKNNTDKIMPGSGDLSEKEKLINL